MSIGFIVFLIVIAAIVGLFALAVRKGRQLGEKQEAYFVSMFPDLQPYYHPKKVLEFVRARLAQAPARSGMTVRNPPGFGVPAAEVSYRNDKGKEREVWRLLDEAGRELSQFLFETDDKDGMVRVGKGKFRVSRAASVKRVRYWHPDREFKWTPDAWKFITRLSEQPIESTDRGTSFSDSSSSSTSSGVATTAAAAAGIAAAGGAFDGGGASNSWDDTRSGSDSETSTAAATSY